MNVLDGASVKAPLGRACDVAIVGSGPAGATVAKALAERGLSVVVVEEGPFLAPEEMPVDGFRAFAKLYRDAGTAISRGRAPMPVVQGRAVGGTSVVNGAICWRLPKDVHDAWVQADPALAEALPWQELEAIFDALERELSIAPTAAEVAGAKNLLMAKGAEALGLEHRPISRNTRACRGLGRCLQGCPEGRKQSMDRTFLPDACAMGAEILASVEVRELLVEGGRCVGVRGRAAGGGAVTVRASRAVVLAASAVQTPLLLWKNRLRHGPVGRHFRGHPGASVTARFAHEVRAWEGATQGHEVIGLRREGLKFEVLGYDLALLASRRKSVGRGLSAQIAELGRWVDWGVAVKAGSEGLVRPGLFGAAVRYDLGPEDMRMVRRGVRVLGEMFLAAGAEVVCPGVHGWHAEVTDPRVMARFEEEGPLDPRAYAMAVTHLFGTCRLGSDPAKSVVRPDFRHVALDRLYVADSSVFPTNTGVNPQTSIMAVARVCAKRIAA